jgi:hypothetical protein
MCDCLKAVGFINSGIACEPGFGRYFAGLIRQINNGARLHVDCSQIDAPDWQIGKINSQIAWNFYLQSPTGGGDCIVYDQQWSEAKEVYKEAGSYGYSMEAVKNAKCVHLSPTEGEIFLFNCRNFHEVLKADSPRIAMGSFIGRMDDGELLLWS